MTTEDTRLSFPFTTPTLFDPPPQFGELRRHEPVAKVRLPTGDQAWLVTRYDDVRRLLADERLSRAAATAPGAPRLGPARPERSSMMAMDPPEHSRLRRLVMPAFTGRRTERLRPRIQEITDDLLVGMAAAGQPADVVAHLAKPLPITVICELLGVPLADRDDFCTWTDAALSLRTGAADSVTGARERLHTYLADLVASKRAAAAPGDDLLDVLISASDAGDRLSPTELVVLASTLITAGYHTVRNAVANSLVALLRHPAHLESLVRHPDLVPRAVEELLRYTPGPASGGTIRVATEDVTYSGVRIRAGEAVIPSTTSANRDESVFPDADTLDPTRPDNNHIAFGHGIHHCLGAQLARAELQIAFGTLLRRFPGIRLAVPAEELTWTTGSMIRGIEVLPVTW